MKKIILALLMLTTLVQAEQGGGKFYQNESIMVHNDKEVVFYYNRSKYKLAAQNTSKLAISLYSSICSKDKDLNNLNSRYTLRYVYIFKDGIYQIDIPKCK